MRLRTRILMALVAIAAVYIPLNYLWLTSVISYEYIHYTNWLIVALVMLGCIIGFIMELREKVRKRRNKRRGLGEAKRT